MSSFEFIIVLVSVIFGLAVAHLLSGLGRAVHNRQKAPLSWLHLTWTGSIFALLSLEWWTLFAMSDEPSWSYWVFLYVLSFSVLLFFLTVLLYPPDPEGAPDYRKTFENSRPWFMSTLSAACLADLGFTALHGNFWNPWYYPVFAVHLAALSAGGALFPKKSYQRFLAVYFFSALVVWGVVVRGVLSA